jgi:hypothetical protein
MITVRPASLEDARWVASRLRREDADEVLIASGMDPRTVIGISFEQSAMVFSMVPEGEPPVALFGVSDDPTTAGLGIVWLLGTTEVARHALGVIEAARMYLRLFLNVYPAGLHNIVWSQNATHLRWCRMLGFEETPGVVVAGQDFIHIYKGQEPNDNHV